MKDTKLSENTEILEDIEDEFHYSDERDDRVKETAEVFTPPKLVKQMLDELGIDWDNPPRDKKFLDPTCGSGNFLVEVAKRGVPLEMIFGVDLMHDNILKTKERLRDIYKDKMSPEDIEFHLERNIIEADALDYHYEFYEHFDGFEEW